MQMNKTLRTLVDYSCDMFCIRVFTYFIISYFYHIDNSILNIDQSLILRVS